MDWPRILSSIDLAGSRGLEIGALHRPVITRSMGRVEYIDRATTEDLKRWYAIDPAVNKDEIVDVDHVWGEQSLLQCVGGERAFSYLVASHVIEHVPDVFGWLEEIASVLVDGGMALFVVPDKRYTFDILRRTSSNSELVHAYARRLRRPEPRQVFDHFYNHRDLSNPAILAGAAPSEMAPSHEAHALLDLVRRMDDTGDYIDSHCWVFTPRSLVEALDLASLLGALPFEIAILEPTADNTHEFFVALRRLPEGQTKAQHREAFLASRARIDLPPEEVSFDHLTLELAATKARLAAIEASTSWRITAPLRALVERARSTLGGRA